MMKEYNTRSAGGILLTLVRCDTVSLRVAAHILTFNQTTAHTITPPMRGDALGFSVYTAYLPYVQQEEVVGATTPLGLCQADLCLTIRRNIPALNEFLLKHLLSRQGKALIPPKILSSMSFILSALYRPYDNSKACDPHNQVDISSPSQESRVRNVCKHFFSSPMSFAQAYTKKSGLITANLVFVPRRSMKDERS